MRIIRYITISLCLATGIIFAIGFGPATEEAGANSTVVGEWQAIHNTSGSFANASCQLCHMNAGGGDGWNAYGWSIRQGIKDQNLSAAAAITAAISLDADGNNIPNLNELNNNAQPGWKAGATNTIYFKNGTEQADQSPPSGIGVLDAGTVTVPIGTSLRTFLPYVTR